MKNVSFSKSESYTPRNKKEKQFIQALTSIQTEHEMTSLLRDLLTLPEIEEFANRLEIARLLLEGGSYEVIAEKAGVSTTTVTRVAHWLYKGCGGYWKTLNQK